MNNSFSQRWEQIKEWYFKYERPISSIGLIGGFIFDSFTLRRIDLIIENVFISAHIIAAALGIIALNMYAGGKWRGKFIEKFHHFIPLIIQFSFGGLFSSVLLFYTRSATFSSSWPFLLVLFGLLIANEGLKKYYEQLIFQIGTLYFSLFSYFVFLVPVLSGTMGDRTFLFSGALSIVVIIVFFSILSKIAPIPVKEGRTYTILLIIGIFSLINIFYFTNIIPPIPLALKDSGVYHSVTHTKDGYAVAEEQSQDSSFFNYFKKYKIMHITAGEPIYVFSSVFAPTSLNTSIVHQWEYYNEQTHEWMIASKITFPINGGRDGGYRGYSMKSNTFPGTWRVTIETTRGLIIGRVNFKIERVSTKPALETIIKS